ncbi:Autophagy-related protein 17 [Sesbania bispinosa]|nr:Autophagy-related protein 17 [Sesbania bispinosa]
MASDDSTAPSLPLSTKKENITPISSKIAELNESRSELLGRIQSLKQDLQSWRSKLDTQVKVYRDELSDLKKTLNVEVEQLRAEFQDLRTTLQQQQEDVTSSLRNLGLQDVPGDVKQSQSQEIKIEEIDKEEQPVLPEEDSAKVAEK